MKKKTNKQTNKIKRNFGRLPSFHLHHRSKHQRVGGGWVGEWVGVQRERASVGGRGGVGGGADAADRPTGRRRCPFFSYPSSSGAGRRDASSRSSTGAASAPVPFFFTQKKNFRSFLLLSLVSVSTHLRFFDLSWGLASRFFCCWCCCCF